MTTIAVPLSDAHAEQIRQRASQAGLSTEEFLRQQIEQLLSHSDQFRDAAAYVLNKNSELYRRLA